MKKIFLALIISGFIIIGLTMTNKLTHIKVYKTYSGEKDYATEKTIKEKEDIKYITEFIKKSQKASIKRDSTTPQYIVKTSSSEYYVWADSEKEVIFVDKKHPSVFYKGKAATKFISYLK